jgi:hypothetical protein
LIPGRIQDARYVVLCAEAEKAGAVTIAPPAPAGCEALGVLTAVDAAFRLGPIVLLPERVFYGWLLRQGAEVIAVLRGTEDILEWGEDADAVPVPHKASGGHVHQGFYGIFSTLQLETAQGAVLDPVSAITAEAEAVTVTGHSLGAPLSLYLGTNLADHVHVTGKFFASPRPGDERFVDWAAGKMTYTSYRYAPDLVPDVPKGLGYSLLPGTVVLPLDPAIGTDPAAAHHAANYAHLLDPVR